MKTFHFLNKVRSHLVTIFPMAPLTPKSDLLCTLIVVFVALILSTNNVCVVTIYCTQ